MTDYDIDNIECDDQRESYEAFLRAQRITIQDILDHITGPVVSIVAHVILLALLGTIVIFKPPPERKDIAVEITEVDVQEMEKIPEPPEPPEEVQTEVEVEIDRPDVQTEAVEVTVEEVTVSDVQDIKMPDLLSVKPNNSALQLPGVFAMRSGSGRKSAIKQYGGSSKTERAVGRGLKWLAEHQNEDGSWGDTPKVKPAMTGLALLAFLAHGETPQSVKYGAVVLKAIRKCIDYSKTMNGAGVISNAGNGYGHAIVTYALGEAYALTKIPMVEEAMNRMCATIVKGMSPDGSYNYNYKNGLGKDGKPRGDLSVAGWNYQALKACFAAGSTVEGLETTIDKAIKGINNFHGCPDGGFSYGRASKGRATHSMTAVGTLCLQLFGAGRSSSCKKGLTKLQTFKVDGKEGSELTMKWKVRKHNPWSIYTWYYQTQAIFQAYGGKGSVWRKWNKAFTTGLLREQESDGHWSTPTEKYPSGKPRGEVTKSSMQADMDLFVYSTALCTLTLEVYYRYLPTFKVVGGSHAKANKTDTSEDDDLGLEIQ